LVIAYWCLPTAYWYSFYYYQTLVQKNIFLKCFEREIKNSQRCDMKTARVLFEKVVSANLLVIIVIILSKPGW